MNLRDELQRTLGGAYTIERELIGGGMSRVFVAEETALRRKVVIKVLPDDMAGHVSVDRFRREIATAARMQQANIVPVLTAGECCGIPYFTMPLVEGESLRERLARENELPIADAVGVLREVARALAYAHEHGVVHRDIKPDNVLLSGGTAMVTDFGVAKAVTDATAADKGALTAAGVALGTPAYMAPEQTAGDPATDHRADIYALGCMAYELLAGAPPFAGRSAQATFAAHATEPAESIERRRADVPPQLAALVMRCLEKGPADRPQHAIEVVHALDKLGPAAPRGAVRRARAWSPSRWLAMAIGSAIVAALGLAALPLVKRFGDTQPRSITVFPLMSVGADTSQTYFAEGMTSELGGAIAHVPGLTFHTPPTAAAIATSRQDARTFAKHLGVSFIVEGDVQRAGDSLRVSVRLTRVSDGHVLWNEPYFGNARNVFAMQDQIARAVASALQVRLASTTPLVAPGTANLAAHDMYLRAKSFHDHDFTEPGLRRAIALYDSAIRLDSAYALPHTGAALAWWNLGDDYLAPSEAMPHMRIEATRALELDPANPTAHALLAETDWPADTGSLKREVELALRDGQSDPLTRFVAGFLLLPFDTTRALMLWRQVLKLEPDNTNYMGWMANGMAAVGARAEAQRVLDTLLTVNPSDAFGRFVRGELRMASGDAAAALEDYRAATPVLENQARAGVARALAALGRANEARTILRELELDRTKRYVSADFIAGVYVALGEPDAAFAWLNKAFAERSTYLEWFTLNPVWAPLRKDPRYATFARTLNVPLR